MENQIPKPSRQVKFELSPDGRIAWVDCPVCRHKHSLSAVAYDAVWNFVCPCGEYLSVTVPDHGHGDPTKGVTFEFKGSLAHVEPGSVYVTELPGNHVALDPPLNVIFSDGVPSIPFPNYAPETVSPMVNLTRFINGGDCPSGNAFAAVATLNAHEIERIAGHLESWAHMCVPAEAEFMRAMAEGLRVILSWRV